MRIAVFSDIHSNLSAFTASLAYAKHLGAEGYAFLGDLISDCPDPHALLELVRGLAKDKPCWFVRGNREEAQTNHQKHPESDGWAYGTHTGSLLYTYEHLTDEDLKFIQAMPMTAQIEIPDCPPVLMCHATPTSTKTLVFPGTEVADDMLKGIKETTVLAGHCHLQFRYEAFGRQLINPGSLGIHSGGQARAKFAMLRCEDGRWIARMMNVDYDRIAELKRFEDSGLIEVGGVWTKGIMNSIRTGQLRTEECMALAHKLAQSEPGAMIPETCMEAAAKQLGII